MNTAKIMLNEEPYPVKETKALNEREKRVVQTRRSVGVGFLHIFILCTFSIVGVLLLTKEAVTRVSDYKNRYYFQFHPFEIELPHYTREERENKLLVPATAKIEAKEEKVKEKTDLDKIVENSPRPEVARYIVEKFGPDHGRLALSIARGENGSMGDDVIGVNKNQTIDVGVFQINYQSHKNKPECSLDKIATYKGNVDCAYVIFSQQKNFKAWVAFSNGRYLAYYFE